MQHAAENDNRPASESPHKPVGGTKADILHELRQTVSKLEARPDAHNLEEKQEAMPLASVFPTGCPHEVWANTPDTMTSATAFALLGSVANDDTPILWVTTRRLCLEHGLPYGPGLIGLGIDPARIILVRTRTRMEALWAIEEGLKVGTLAAVIGELEDIDLTESRRLSLVTREYMTRCVMILRNERAPSSASFSRHQISPVQSGAPSFAPYAPGQPHVEAALVKHRGGQRPNINRMEWSDAPDRFPVVAPLANRTPYEKPKLTPGFATSKQRAAG
ncbi:ImuA family protein [Kordiimonas sp.]|uniref:ImuA family protein n=1 Tax=Kordiimonas sp. TaxID=1970157 RepID=UPI003A9051FA